MWSRGGPTEEAPKWLVDTGQPLLRCWVGQQTPQSVWQPVAGQLTAHEPWPDPRLGSGFGSVLTHEVLHSRGGPLLKDSFYPSSSGNLLFHGATS